MMCFLFVSTGFLPCEISMMTCDVFSYEWSYLKSSIDLTEALVGRPYGSCGLICKKEPGLLVRSIACDWDRISGIEVYRDQRKVLCVFVTYLPYVDNKENRTEQYLETISNLQVLVDSCSQVPWMMVGDCNTWRPQENVLHQKVYSTQPFSKRSLNLNVKARYSQQASHFCKT